MSSETQELRKFLVPVADPAAPGLAAAFALNFATALDGSVTLFHVVEQSDVAAEPDESHEHTEPTPAARLPVDEAPPTSLTRESELPAGEAGLEQQPEPSEEAAYAERLLTDYAHSVHPDGNLVSVSVVAGEPAERIVSMAHRGEYDAVVMEGIRTSRLAKILFGSTVDRVESDLQVPVIVLQPDGDDFHQSMSEVPDAVIVPLDGEPESEHAIPVAEDLALKLECPIEFARTVSSVVAMASPSAPISMPHAAATEAQQSEADDYLEVIVSAAREHGLDARANVDVGDITDLGRKIAGRYRNALFVSDASDRSGLVRLLFGRVPEDLVHSTSNPVLIVPRLLGTVID